MYYCSISIIRQCYYIRLKRITHNILPTKTTAAQNEVALSYHKVRGLYFLAVIFAATMIVYKYTR